MDTDRASGVSKTNKGMNFAETGFGSLFQTLSTWDAGQQQSRLMIIIGAMVEAIQFCAFAIGPVYAFNHPVVYEFTVAVFAFLVPIWDRNYGPFEYTNYIIPVCILLGLLLLGCGVFLSFVFKVVEQSEPLLVNGSRFILESVASWMLLPTLHIFMGGVMCDGSTLHNFREELCWTSMHIATSLIAAVGIGLTFFFGLTVATTLGNPHPQSTHLRSRPHNYVELLVFVVKSVLVVLFHLLGESGSTGAFSIILVVASLVLLAAHVTMLPFYHSEMTRIRCVTYSVTAFAATINCITSYSGAWFVTMRLNSFALAGLLPLAAMWGYMAHDIRPSKQLLHHLDCLLNLAAVPTHKARFPFKRGIMSQDMKLSVLKFRSLEEDLLQEFAAQSADANDETDQVWSEIVAQSTEVLVPYVDSVVLSTDAELATRFLEMHRKITNLSVSSNPLVFAQRIFMKSILLFPRSGVTRFHFALFLFAHANKHNIALEVLLEVQNQVHDEHDILVHYNAHKFISKIRQLFGARDESHIHAFKRARQLHKEALSTMSLFWSKLMESKSDLTTPGMLTSQISSKRENARLEYERALAGDTSNDRLLLSTYATFLEQVMCDPVAADQFRQLAEDAAEEKRQRLMRGSKSKKSFEGRETKLTPVENENDDDIIAVTNRSSIVTVITIGFIAVSICSIGMLIIATTASSSAVKHVNTVSQAGIVLRGLAESELYITLAARECLNLSACSVQFVANVSTAEAEMRAALNSITYGSYSSKQGTILYEKFTREATVATTPHGGGILQDEWRSAPFIEPLPSYSSLDRDSNFDLLIDSLWILVIKTSSAITDFVNHVAQRKTYYSATRFINPVLVAFVAIDFEGVLHSIESDQIETFGAFSAGFGALFAAAVLSLAACFFMFVSTIRTISQTKGNTLKLFTIIPYPTQEMLCSQAKSQLESFEKAHSQEEEEDNPEIDEVDEDEQEASSPVVVEKQQPDRKSLHGMLKVGSMRKSVLSLSKQSAQKELFDDEDERKLSRFFGKPRANSFQTHAPILKKPGAPKNTKRRIKFNIQGDTVQAPAADRKKRLAEPKVAIESAENLINDYETSILQIEKDIIADQNREQQKREEQTDKLLRGEINSERSAIRKAGTKATTGDAVNVSQEILEEEAARDHNVSMLTTAKFVMALVVLVALALVVVGYMQRTTLSAKVEISIDHDADVNHYVEKVHKMITYSNFFSAFGTGSSAASTVGSHFYNQFFDIVIKELLELVVKYSDPSIDPVPAFSKNIHHLEKQASGLASFCMKIMAQSARGNGNAVDTVLMLSTFTDLPNNCSDPVFTLNFPHCEEFPDEFVFPSTKELVKAEPAERVVLLSLRQAASFRRRELLQDFLQLSNKTARAIEKVYHDKIEEARTQQSVLIVAALAITAFAAAFYLVRCIIMVGDERERVIKITVVMALLAAVATLVLSLNVSASMKDFLEPYNHALDDLLLLENSYFLRHNEQGLRYAVRGDDLSQLWTSDSVKLQNDLLPRLTKILKEIKLPAEQLVAGFLARDEPVRRLQRVSAFLGYAAFAKEKDVFPWTPRNDPRFISTYDYTLEPNSEADRVQYATDPNIAFMYSNSATDPSKNASTLMAMSRFALFGRRGYDYFTAASKNLYNLGETILEQAQRENINKRDDLSTYLGISIALVAYAALGALFIAFLPVIDRMRQSAAREQSSTELHRVLFGKTQTIGTLAFSFIGAILVVQIVIIFIGAQPSSSALHAVALAREREFAAATSLSTALQFNNSVHENWAFEVVRLTNDLKQLDDKLANFRNELYFLPSSKDFGKFEPFSAAQRAITFGGNNSLDVQFQQWRSVLSSLINTVPAVSLAAVGTLSYAGNEYVISSAVKTSVAASTSSILAAYPALQQMLRASSKQYEQDGIKVIQSSIVPNIILCIAVILVCIALHRLVFQDLSDTLEKEEQGTRLTLNMIPQSVRNLIPKISLYLETGLLIEEHDEAKVYLRNPAMNEFIAKWSADETTDTCFAVLENVTTHGYIVISSVGIVQFQNKQAISLLGYDDLPGRNISVILDEPLKGLHDGFLKRYVQQGISRIIGMGRDVVGTTKSGLHKHMYLHLDAAVRSNGDVYFVGQLELYQMDSLKDKS